jgi:hypothetical protein
MTPLTTKFENATINCQIWANHIFLHYKNEAQVETRHQQAALTINYRRLKPRSACASLQQGMWPSSTNPIGSRITNYWVISNTKKLFFFFSGDDSQSLFNTHLWNICVPNLFDWIHRYLF